MKKVFKKWWFYLIVLIIIAIIVFTIILVDKDEHNKSSNNNPKLKIYDINEGIYVIEEDEKIEEEKENPEETQELKQEAKNKNDNIPSSNKENNTSTTKPNHNNSIQNSSSNIPSNNANNKPSNETNKTIEATKEYYCVGNFELKGKKCVYSYSSNALIKYSCSKGDLVGSRCEYTTTTKTPMNPYSVVPGCSGLKGGQYCNCAGGSYENGTCYVYTEKTITENAIVNYYCPDDYNLVNNKCLLYSETDAPFKLSCPIGYTLIGLECKKN